LIILKIVCRLRDEDSGSGSEEPKEKSLTTFKDVEPGPGEHPLQYTYCFWYSKKPPGRSQDPSSFEKNMKIVGTFRSVSMNDCKNYLLLIWGCP